MFEISNLVSVESNLFVHQQKLAKNQSAPIGKETKKHFFKKIYVEFLSIGRDSLFSNLLLCRIIDIACYIAMVLISMKVCLIVSFGILNFSSKIFIEGVCVVALVPTMMTISGSTFHPLLVMLSISGWYFSVLRVMVSDENLSLQYVNSIN